MDIPKQSRPIKTTLKNLSSDFFGGKMSFTSMRVAKLHDLLELMVGHTSLDNLIRAIFEEVRIIPREIMHISKEFAIIIG